MKSVSVILESLKEKNEFFVVKSKEEISPPWRLRFRLWFVWISREIFRPSSMVRLVSPNSRPLERHEFESLRVRNERHRIL
jgi:uncharacterized protein YfaT (DUF1175 family)